MPVYVGRNACEHVIDAPRAIRLDAPAKMMIRRTLSLGATFNFPDRDRQVMPSDLSFFAVGIHDVAFRQNCRGAACSNGAFAITSAIDIGAAAAACRR
jgi:hypothetical protein